MGKGNDKGGRREVKFTHFHPDLTGETTGKDYPMTEEEIDIGWIILTCSKCGTEVFMKPG